jgi:hypothetical protein
LQVGVHGAGFTNTIFMRPGSAILQVMPFGEYGGGLLVGREYKNIAQALSATYMEWYDGFPSLFFLSSPNFQSSSLEVVYF